MAIHEKVNWAIVGKFSRFRDFSSYHWEGLSKNVEIKDSIDFIADSDWKETMWQYSTQALILV